MLPEEEKPAFAPAPKPGSGPAQLLVLDPDFVPDCDHDHAPWDGLT